MKEVLLLILLIGIPEVAGATARQHSHSELGALAAREAERRAIAAGFDAVEVKVMPLDSRLGLKQCEEPVKILEGRHQFALGKVNIGIRCDLPEAWTIYLRATVTSSMSVPVLTSSMNRSDLIGKNDISYRIIDIASDLRGIVLDPRNIVGKEVTRDLHAGRPLRRSDLKSPQLIKRGQSVSITSSVAGLKVTMKGKALGNAAAGDRLWVENQSSQKRVEGVVTDTGEVLVQ